MKIEIDIKIPDGHEFVRFGIPKDWDYFISNEENDLKRHGF